MLLKNSHIEDKKTGFFQLSYVFFSRSKLFPRQFLDDEHRPFLLENFYRDVKLFNDFVPEKR